MREVILSLILAGCTLEAPLEPLKVRIPQEGRALTTQEGSESGAPLACLFLNVVGAEVPRSFSPLQFSNFPHSCQLVGKLGLVSDLKPFHPGSPLEFELFLRAKYSKLRIEVLGISDGGFYSDLDCSRGNLLELFSSSHQVTLMEFGSAEFTSEAGKNLSMSLKSPEEPAFWSECVGGGSR